MNRKMLQLELNKVNTKYQELKLELEKLNDPPNNIERLNRIRRSLELRLKEQFADRLMELNDKGEINL